MYGIQISKNKTRKNRKQTCDESLDEYFLLTPGNNHKYNFNYFIKLIMVNEKNKARSNTRVYTKKIRDNGKTSIRSNKKQIITKSTKKSVRITHELPTISSEINKMPMTNKNQATCWASTNWTSFELSLHWTHSDKQKLDHIEK